MLTIAQIRAARALLDWSQSDLADKAGLSQTGIARIENGTNKPNSSTLAKITKAFDLASIEFIDDTGVKKRLSEVKILHGGDAMRQFFNDVYETAKTPGGEICVFNGTPSQLTKWISEEWYEMHRSRMSSLENEFQYKIIVKDGEASAPASNYATYKYFPEKLFNDKTICILNGRIYFRDHTEQDLRLLRISQADIASSMKVLFDIAWNSVAKDTPS